MPPKNKYSKEQIVDAAFKIAEKEGIDGITIRKVANQLGSSIAPIYVNFKDVHELKRAIIEKIVQLSHRMINEQNSGSPFRDIGIASLRFAKEYPMLSRDFVMKPNKYAQQFDEEMGTGLIDQMKKDPDLEGFTDDQLQMILFKLRAFQIGLTIMVSNGMLPENMELEQMAAIVDDVAVDVVLATRMRNHDDV